MEKVFSVFPFLAFAFLKSEASLVYIPILLLNLFFSVQVVSSTHQVHTHGDIVSLESYQLLKLITSKVYDKMSGKNYAGAQCRVTYNFCLKCILIKSILNIRISITSTNPQEH